MGELTNRVHVLLDDDRLRRLRQRAANRGVSVGALVREAIDRDLQHDDSDRARAALESFLAAPPLPVGTPEELDREIEEMYDRGEE
jgi:plasmid stability protein